MQVSCTHTSKCRNERHSLAASKGNIAPLASLLGFGAKCSSRPSEEDGRVKASVECIAKSKKVFRHLGKLECNDELMSL